MFLIGLQCEAKCSALIIHVENEIFWKKYKNNQQSLLATSNCTQRKVSLAMLSILMGGEEIEKGKDGKVVNHLLLFDRLVRM